MGQSLPFSVQTWSTDEVPLAQRVDYFEAACATALIPFSVTSVGDEDAFHASIEAVGMGPLSLMRHRGGHHAVRSGKAEIERQLGESFHVLASRDAPWRLAHRSEHRFERDVATLTDSRLPLSLETLGEYDFVNVALPVSWVREWLPDPQVLVGRAITPHTPWGRALTSFMIAMTPESVLRGALPPQCLVDHLGALLAFAASEFDGNTSAPKRSDSALVDRIKDCIRQRSCELNLTALDVAASLNISPRTLHRHLAADSATFGSVLIAARVDVAARMLASDLFRRVTTAEIGYRAGFADSSHFSRTFRKAMGLTPLKFRRGGQASPGG